MNKKVALITGSTSGIGKATALKFAQQNVRVVVSGRRTEQGLEVVDEIKKNGGEAHFVEVNVNSEKNVTMLLQETLKKYGRLDYGVNNAAIYIDSTLICEASAEKFNEMIQTNVVALLWCMQQQLKIMKKAGSGSIVNLASIAGLNGMPYAGTYSATKHAVVGLTKSAALEYATQNIRVNAVAPGPVMTDIIQLAIQTGNYDEDSMNTMVPMGRMGRPEEIANGIVWLCSDEASFVTGHILSIDGGFQAK